MKPFSEIKWIPCDDRSSNDGLVRAPKNSDLFRYLTFSQFCGGNEDYVAILNSLPRIKGLRRQDKRMDFAIDLVDSLKKNGFRIKTQKEDVEANKERTRPDIQ